MKKTVLIFLVLIPFLTNAQDDKPKYGISFSGFVKNDFFFDTRQNVTIREGHFLLYPMNESLDADKKDINSGMNYNFLSIQSRLTGKITGPDAFGAKTSGVLEADFFGNESSGLADVNGFRLRHAVIKLNWEKSELLLGQYWHPMFQPGCYAGVVPFQPFSRNPQIRYTYKLGNISILGVASAQRDFTSYGGSSPLRNSGTPELNLQMFYNKKNDESKTELLAGFGGGYKSLKPTLATTNGGKTYVTEEMVSGIIGTAFFKYSNKAFTYKLQGVYGQNASDLIMLGGYVVKEVTDTAKNTVNFATVNCMSAWTEFQTNGEKIQFGIFAGYTSNLGTTDSVTNYLSKASAVTATQRGYNINYVYRVAPRVVFISGNFNFALEAEYTAAAYATKNDLDQLNINSNGQVTDSKEVANVRVLLSAIYKF
jgi:hypothetical protein